MVAFADVFAEKLTGTAAALTAWQGPFHSPTDTRCEMSIFEKKRSGNAVGMVAMRAHTTERESMLGASAADQADRMAVSPYAALPVPGGGAPSELVACLGHWCDDQRGPMTGVGSNMSAERTPRAAPGLLAAGTPLAAPVQWKADNGASGAKTKDGNCDDQKAQAADAAPDTDAAEDAARDAELAEKGINALACLKKANHKKGAKLRGKMGQGEIKAGKAFPTWFMELQNALSISGEWKQEEEAGQQVLAEYAMLFCKRHNNGQVPPTLEVFIQYMGRSAQNNADAQKGGYLGTSHFGGALGIANWCTQTSTTAVIDALREKGYSPTEGRVEFLSHLIKLKDSGGRQGGSYGTAAYDAPLNAGDMVMYLWDKCQYGGHTATVIEDLGDSFVHVSGNTGDGVGIGVSESKRLKQKPANLNLRIANDSSSDASRAAAKQHINTVNFGGGALVYSITRYGMIFDQLEELEQLDPTSNAAEVSATLKKLHLQKLRA